MLEVWLKAYVLFGGIDPANDLAAGSEALAAAELVVAVTTHLPDSLRAVAHVVLPIGAFAESAGTFVNAEGRWQSWAGAAKLVGESRPGWKVLRVLANLLNVPGIEFVSAEEVREAVRTLCGARNGATRSIDAAGGGGARRRLGAPRPPQRRRAVARHTSVSDRHAGARIGIFRQNQGRAHGPRRDLIMWQWDPLRVWLSGQITPYWTDPLLTAVQILMVVVGLILIMAFYTLAERKDHRLDAAAQGPESRQSVVHAGIRVSRSRTWSS